MTTAAGIFMDILRNVIFFGFGIFEGGGGIWYSALRIPCWVAVICFGHALEVEGEEGFALG